MFKRNRKLFWLILYGAWVTAVVLLLGGCRAGQASAGPLAQARLQELVDSREIMFEADFAFPLTSQAYINAANATVARAGGNSLSRISLQGEGYFLKISGNHVESHLPYYGVRDNFSEYGRPDGVELDSETEDFTLIQKSSGAFQLVFFARQKAERFRITLDLFPGGKANLIVYSGQRDVIRYEGRGIPANLNK